MAFLGLFGKKKQEPIPEPLAGQEDELGLSGIEERHEEQPPIGAPPGFGTPEFAPQAIQTPRQTTVQQPEREYEVLSAKLDALKAILDSINQRLENLERIARGDHERHY